MTGSSERRRVLVLCTANSARSQMAEGLLRHDFGDRLDVRSAGTITAAVRPEAIAVLAEIGIDISQARSKRLDEFLDEPFDEVLTVCDSAAETCPVFPGPALRRHRGFADPTGVGRTEAERLEAFRLTRDDLRAWFRELYGDVPA
jgi:arsenate reductase